MATSRRTGKGKEKTSSPKQVGKSWFLGIGINQYQAFSQLHNAVKDVEDILGLLLQRYDIEEDCVVHLKDAAASREAIIDELDDLDRVVGENDKLIIYYSGHGHVDHRGLGYWIPYDAKKGRTSNYIRNSTIRDYVKVIKARHTLLISDACFSGSLFAEGTVRSDLALADLEGRLSRWAICSGRHDEEVNDGSPGKNSPFARSILDVLGSNKKPWLNAGELADLVLKYTRANNEQLPQGKPLFGVGDRGGQYIFKQQQREERRWLELKQKGTMSALLKYVEEFPTGKYQDDALELIGALEQTDKSAWALANEEDSIAAVLRYLKDFPEGRFRQSANELKAKLLISTPISLSPVIPPVERVSSLLNKVEDTFTDPRDGQVYKTVELNGQTWLAENLNFEVEDSWWYDNDSENGKQYGRLYTWEAAQAACPPGWRVPTDEEWKALARSFGGYYEVDTGKEIDSAERSYEALIEGGSSGIHALLGGRRSSYGSFGYLGEYGGYWSSTAKGADSAWYYSFNGYYRKLYRGNWNRSYARSCRCLKD